MKSFKSFLKEETMPFANVRSGGMDIEDSAVRDNINSLLAGMTNGKFVTPYIALERVAKTLANFHIFMPAHSFLEGDSGTAIVPINQYGIKVGMSNAATFVVKGEIGKDFTHGSHVEGEDNEISTKSEITPKYTVYFEYRMSDCGMFEIFCEVVDQDELDEILADLEAELNDETEEEQLDEELADTPTSSPGSTSQMVKGPAPVSNDPMVKNLPTLSEPGMDPARTAKLAQMTQSKSVAGGPVTSADKQAAAQLEEEQLDELSPELVGKVANKRFRQDTGLDKAPKKAQTTAAAKSLARAAKKKFIQSNVGVLKT